MSKTARELLDIIDTYLGGKSKFEDFKESYENMYWAHTDNLTEEELDEFEGIFSEMEYCEPEYKSPYYSNEKKLKEELRNRAARLRKMETAPGPHSKEEAA